MSTSQTTTNKKQQVQVEVVAAPSKEKAVVSLATLSLGTLLVAVSLGILASPAYAVLFVGAVLFLFGAVIGYNK